MGGGGIPTELKIFAIHFRIKAVNKTLQGPTRFRLF